MFLNNLFRFRLSCGYHTYSVQRIHLYITVFSDHLLKMVSNKLIFLNFKENSSTKWQRAIINNKNHITQTLQMLTITKMVAYMSKRENNIIKMLIFHISKKQNICKETSINIRKSKKICREI